MLKKFLAFTGWLLLLSTLLFLCLVIGLLMDWDTFNILLIWFGLVVTSVTIWVLTHSLVMHIKQNGKRQPLLQNPLSRLEYVLRERWKSGAKILKRRPARPWYILLDTSGCSRRKLAQNSITDYLDEEKEQPNKTDQSPRTLQWWVDKKITFLELSDHFFKGIREYDQAWQKLTTWIGNIRAPAGMVITISVSELCDDEDKALSVRLQKLQARLHTLSRKTQRQLPLYILITECEKVPAFSLWASQLSSTQQQKPLGTYWPDPVHSDDQAINVLIDRVKQTLDFSRLSMPGSHLTPDERSALLDFPETFTHLQSSLNRCIEQLCSGSDSTEPAGLWFTCSTLSTDDKNLSEDVFLQELFTNYLPDFARTRKIIRKNNLKCLLFSGGISLIYSGLLISSCIYSATLMVSSPAHLTAGGQAKQLVINESRYSSPWKYVPFIPMLDYQHRQIENKLVENTPHQPTDNVKQLALYQQQFQAASPTTQRQIILVLAKSIITLQNMRDGTTLSSLMLMPQIPETLRLFSIPEKKDPLVQLALQRSIMQQPAGIERLTELRRVLAQLVNSDPDLKWLTAPDAGLPDITAAAFWPELSQRVTLSGIWTQKGKNQLDAWILLLNQASNSSPFPLLQQFTQTLPELRQNAWLRMLLSISQSLSSHPQQMQSPDQLIALSFGNSPSMKLAQNIQDELADIPDDQTQAWLGDLRRLQTLKYTANTAISLQKIKNTNNVLRKYLAKWLQFPAPITIDDHDLNKVAAWKMWRETVTSVVNRTINPTNDFPSLVRGLFTPISDAKNDNSLNMLYVRYNKLRSLLAQQNGQPGTDAVWLLYRNDADVLLGYAMNSTSCWLNAQWQQLVMWPMRKNATLQDYDKQQEATWQGIVDFINGPAQNLLLVTGKGPQAGEYNGQTLPLTEQFLDFAHQIFMSDDFRAGPDLYDTRERDKLALFAQNLDQLKQQQSTEQETIYPIDITSEPATIPGGARIVPTGVALTLNCGKSAQTLDSMNLAVSKQFIWQPGQCQNITLKVVFPQFSAKLNFTGPGAWPEFLARFENGSALFEASEFKDGEAVLKETGIQYILIQLQLSDQKALQDAWSQWQTTESQISTLASQQQATSDHIQSQNPSDILRGKLAQLPDNVAFCQ